MSRCERCGCRIELINGLEVCDNCGVVGQKEEEIKYGEAPNYV